MLMEKVTGCAKLNSEFCALVCIMLMDYVTDCAKLYSEFLCPLLPQKGDIVSPFWGNGADIVSAALRDII